MKWRDTGRFIGWLFGFSVFSAVIHALFGTPVRQDANLVIAAMLTTIAAIRERHPPV